MSSGEQTWWDLHLIGLAAYKCSSSVTKESRLGGKTGRELTPCHCLPCSFSLIVTLTIEVLRGSLSRSLPADSQLAVLASLGMV